MTVSPTVQTVIGLPESKQDVPKQNSQDKNPWYSVYWRGVLAEFISTVLLILFGCMACMPIDNGASPMYAAFGFGLVVLINVQIFGHISGAYMNPSIVLLSVIWGNTSIFLGVIYVITQCLAAIVGYGILTTLTVSNIASDGICATGPIDGQAVVQTLFIEFCLTAALVLVNCALWDPVHADKQDSASIKFGLTIVGLSLVGGPATGASMNPARTLGPAVWTGVWTHHWAYWAGPLGGSFCAAILYKYIFLKYQKN